MTPRTSTLAIDGRIGARGATDLAKFIGVWVVAEMKVVYGNSGSVALTIRKISDGTMLFNYSGGADTWDDGASAHDFKAGIYRSLNNRGMLRDEQVRFADFCASKMSAADCDDGAAPRRRRPRTAGRRRMRAEAAMPARVARGGPVVRVGHPAAAAPAGLPVAAPAARQRWVCRQRSSGAGGSGGASGSGTGGSSAERQRRQRGLGQRRHAVGRGRGRGRDSWRQRPDRPPVARPGGRRVQRQRRRVRRPAGGFAALALVALVLGMARRRRRG